MEFIPDVDWILDEIPPWLQPVAYLAGWHWPQGKARAWRAIAGFAGAAADTLEPLIEQLSRERSRTQAVVAGQTAQAVDTKFATLLDGQDSLPTLVDGLRTLHDTADSTATEIESAEWGIVSALAIAYWSLRAAYATFVADPVGSLAEISIIEALAELTIGQVWRLAVERVETVLAELAAKDVLAGLLTAGLRAAGLGAAQELGIEGIEFLEVHRSGIDVAVVGDSALSMGLAGLAGGAVGHVVGGVLSTDGNLGLRLAKGALTGLASGEAANVVGTLAGGGHLGADTWVGGALGVAEGLHGVGGEHGETGGQQRSVHDPTESPVAANAIDTHPTLRLEKAPDGTFCWPGERAGAAGDPANDGAPQAHPASPFAPAGDPGGATGSPANGSVGAGDPGARSSLVRATAGCAPTQGDAAALGPRGGSGNPAAGTATSPADAATAGGGRARPETTAPLGTNAPAEGKLDLSTIRLPTSTAAVIDTASPRVTEPLSLSDVTGASSLPCALPHADVRAPSVTPGAASADHISDFGPIADAPAGLVDSSAGGKSIAEPSGASAARRVDTIAAHADGGMHNMTGAEQATAGRHAASVDRGAQAGRSEADSHVTARVDSAAADRQRPPADLITKRQDPSTRPEVNRHDPSSGPRGRPAKLRRSGVARDVSEVLQPTAATRAPDPLAATEETGTTKTRHDGSGPGPGEPESHNGGRNGIDGHNTPDPATTGDGAGDGRGATVTGPGGTGDDRPFGDAIANRQPGVDAPAADSYPPAANYTADAVGFGRLLAELRDGAGMTQFQLGVDSRLRSISTTYIARIENGARMPSRAQAHDLFIALRIPEAPRQQYLAHFYPPADTTPTNYTADAIGFGRLLATLRDGAHMTHQQLATAAGVQTEYVKQIQKGRYVPRLPRFRQLWDALDIHGPPRVEAVRHFHCHRYPVGADPDEERDFWDLVDTEVGSPQEQEQRNLIYERHGYDDTIAKPVARAWARYLYDHYGLKADRDDLYEDAVDVILTAVDYHVPTVPFSVHAWANCRGTIYQVAEALLEKHRHEVPLMVSRSGEEFQRQLPDPTATRAFEDSDFEDRDLEDSDFEDRVRAVLADLRDVDKATQLVALIVKHDTPLDLAAERLGLSGQTATEIMSTVIPRLRTAFQPLPDDT